jgi:hypothetical protein
LSAKTQLFVGKVPVEGLPKLHDELATCRRVLVKPDETLPENCFQLAGIPVVEVVYRMPEAENEIYMFVSQEEVT